MITTYIFYLLSTLTITSALYVVFSRNPMYSVLSLIFCFFTIAGHYIMLNAQFLAIVHLIVYAGAIMVLFLFVVMLLNLNPDTEPHKANWIKFAAVFAGGLLFLILIASLKGAAIETNELAINSDIGFVQKLGKKLFTEFLLPFEISSILFLSAMVGSVVLAKKEKY